MLCAHDETSNVLCTTHPGSSATWQAPGTDWFTHSVDAGAVSVVSPRGVFKRNDVLLGMWFQFLPLLWTWGIADQPIMMAV